VRGLVQEAPEPRDVTAGDGGCHVLRCIAKVHGVDLRVACCREQARGKREDTAAICSGGLGEDADDLGGVLHRQLFEGVEPCAWERFKLRRREGDLDGAEEGDALDFAGVRVGACEDGLEDTGKVERVEGRRERARDDRACPWEVAAGGV
jgi:hypothetical protein